MTLTPEGKAAWIEFYNAHAEEQADLTGDLSAAWSKLEGYAARLALVVHFARWFDHDGMVRAHAPITAMRTAPRSSSVRSGSTRTRARGRSAIHWPASARG